MTIVGVISDTHISEGGKRQLPPRIYEDFKDASLILHAGDLTTMSVVRDLEAIAPVYAVHGNTDEWDVMQQLPKSLQLEIEDCRIGMAHGHEGASGPAQKTAANALSFFPEAHCVVFGHSHIPLIEWLQIGGRKVLLFNPGSATNKRWQPSYGCGRLLIDGTSITPELLLW